MKHINWTFLAGLLLAAISLTFSATGLTHLFAGAGISIPIMAIAFELAKVAGTVWLMNRTWAHGSVVPVSTRISGFILSSGLILSILALSCVSSLGTYGYLTRAYRAGRVNAVSSSTSAQSNAELLRALESRRASLMALVESVPDAAPTAKARMFKTVQPQIDKLDQQIATERSAHSTAATAAIKADADIGEMKYAGQLLGTNEEGIVKIVVTTLAFLLDPLAVLLVMASGIKTRRETVEVCSHGFENGTCCPVHGDGVLACTHGPERNCKQCEQWYQPVLVDFEEKKAVAGGGPNIVEASGTFNARRQPRTLGQVLERVSGGTVPKTVANARRGAPRAKETS